MERGLFRDNGIRAGGESKKKAPLKLLWKEQKLSRVSGGGKKVWRRVLSPVLGQWKVSVGGFKRRVVIKKVEFLTKEVPL